MIKYYIRTTLERKLNKSISRELGENYTLLVDYEHKPVESFIKQLEAISEHNVVLLEDDVILCKNFKYRIEEVISKYSSKVINFFTDPMRYFITKEDYAFCYNQCTYYPKGVGEKLAKEMKSILNNNFYYKNCKQYDSLESQALHNMKIKHIQYRPCLVQHLDYSSLMDNNVNFCRRSPYFVDYLDELSISYKESRLSYNRQKLIELMNEKFKNIL